MSILLIITVVSGFFFARLCPQLLGFENYLIEPIIYALIFLSGISIGYDVNIRKTFKKLGALMIVTPTAILAGSILGAVIAGSFLDISFAKSCCVASGLGWYSLSAIIIGEYDSYLSALSLLSNIFRELMSFLVVPFVAKYIGYLEVIAPCASTSMDTTLPCIINSTDERTGLVAFANGVILIFFVPMLVQFFVNLAYVY